uniref:Pecanex-like protein n=1 Tax=Steinernema glaseri TaxID=37863 RepID=A0A1I7YR35_9BILA
EEPIDEEPEGSTTQQQRTQRLIDSSQLVRKAETSHLTPSDYNRITRSSSRRGNARSRRVNESMEVPKSLSKNKESPSGQCIVIGEETLPEPTDIAAALIRDKNENLTYWVDGVATLNYYFIGVNLRNRIYAEELNGGSYEYDATDVGDLSTVIAHEIDRYML